MEINADKYLFPLYHSLTPFLCVLVITCCFHSSYCMLLASEFRSTVTCKMGIFIAGVNHTFENIFLVLLVKWKYRIPLDKRYQLDATIVIYYQNYLYMFRSSICPSSGFGYKPTHRAQGHAPAAWNHSHNT
jgi:hypothetical protein